MACFLASVSLCGALLFLWLGFDFGVQEAYDDMRDGEPQRPFLLLAAVLVCWSLAAALIVTAATTFLRLRRRCFCLPAMVPALFAGMYIYEGSAGILALTLPVAVLILGQAWLAPK